MKRALLAGIVVVVAVLAALAAAAAFRPGAKTSQAPPVQTGVVVQIDRTPGSPTLVVIQESSGAVWPVTVPARCASISLGATIEYVVNDPSGLTPGSVVFKGLPPECQPILPASFS